MPYITVTDISSPQLRTVAINTDYIASITQTQSGSSIKVVDQKVPIVSALALRQLLVLINGAKSAG